MTKKQDNRKNLFEKHYGKFDSMAERFANRAMRRLPPLRNGFSKYIDVDDVKQHILIDVSNAFIYKYEKDKGKLGPFLRTVAENATKQLAMKIEDGTNDFNTFMGGNAYAVNEESDGSHSIEHIGTVYTDEVKEDAARRLRIIMMELTARHLLMDFRNPVKFIRDALARFFDLSLDHSDATSRHILYRSLVVYLRNLSPDDFAKLPDKIKGELFQNDIHVLVGTDSIRRARNVYMKSFPTINDMFDTIMEKRKSTPSVELIIRKFQKLNHFSNRNSLSQKWRYYCQANDLDYISDDVNNRQTLKTLLTAFPPKTLVSEVYTELNRRGYNYRFSVVAAAWKTS